VKGVGLKFFGLGLRVQGLGTVLVVRRITSFSRLEFRVLCSGFRL